MRTVAIPLAAMLAFCAGAAARAADLDYDYLRGAEYDAAPVAAVDWSGVYVGGHGGFTAGGFSQREALQSTLANYFRYQDVEAELSASQLIALPGSRASGGSFGAFAGVNFQFDGIVMGVEVDYTHSDLNAWANDALGRIATTKGGMSEVVSLAGRSNTQIEDYGTVRARAGYAFGNLLPYVTGGLAVGQAKITDTASVINYGYDATTYAANQALTTGKPAAVYSHGYASFNPNYPLNYSTPPGGGVQTVPYGATALTANARTRTVVGFSVGAGLEYALTSNILLRGEYQFVRFQSFNGHEAQLNTFRGGAAVKF